MVTREIAINMVKSFVNDCKLAGLEFDKVLIFGSVAKDQIHDWSDIDILLVSDKFNNNPFDNLKLYSKINIKYPSIETHPVAKDYFLSGDGFIEEIMKNNIQIV